MLELGSTCYWALFDKHWCFGRFTSWKLQRCIQYKTKKSCYIYIYIPERTRKRNNYNRNISSTIRFTGFLRSTIFFIQTNYREISPYWFLLQFMFFIHLVSMAFLFMIFRLFYHYSMLSFQRELHNNWVYYLFFTEIDRPPKARSIPLFNTGYEEMNIRHNHIVIPFP